MYALNDASFVGVGEYNFAQWLYIAAMILSWALFD